MSKFLVSGELSEQSIHKTVMDWVRLHENLEKHVLHIPNEGRRSTRYGKLLKTLGMRKGVADLFIALVRHDFPGAWIELKSINGILSKAQSDFLKDMASEGYFTKVCYSIDDAIQTINWYCFVE